MHLVNEEWRLLSGVDKSQYLISSLGRIFNTLTRQFVKASIHKSRCGQYLRHSLGKRRYMTHKLVALTFPDIVKRDCLEANQVDHLDGNTLNPAATNLHWKTQGFNLEAWHRGRSIKYNGIVLTVARKKKKKAKPKKKNFVSLNGYNSNP